MELLTLKTDLQAISAGGVQLKFNCPTAQSMNNSSIFNEISLLCSFAHTRAFRVESSLATFLANRFFVPLLFSKCRTVRNGVSNWSSIGFIERQNGQRDSAERLSFEAIKSPGNPPLSRFFRASLLGSKRVALGKQEVGRDFHAPAVEAINLRMLGVWRRKWEDFSGSKRPVLLATDGLEKYSTPAWSSHKINDLSHTYTYHWRRQSR